MNGDDPRAGDAYSEPRVPDPLRDQVHDLFVDERGYEPASFQEALSVVVDLAATSRAAQNGSGDAQSAGPSREAAVDDASEPDSAASNAAAGVEENSESSAGSDPDSGTESAVASSTDGDAATDRSIDAVVDESSADGTNGHAVSFDEYVDGLEETRQNPSPSVESILDTEHADGVVRELAAEVLEEMTQDAFDELEHGVDQGVAGVTDGMGASATVDGAGTAPSDTTGDGVPDSLTADPQSDCAVCGRSHPVSVLHTTILEEEGSVALVCPSCAE